MVSLKKDGIMKISIIVPVYNVSEYLKKCIDSLVNQTFKSIEIIIVNDGSTDNSEEIVKEYQKKVMNIKYTETSAKTGHGIKDLFNELYSDIYEKNKESIEKNIKLVNSQKKKGSGCC